MSEEKRRAGKDKNLPTHDTHADDQKPEKKEIPSPDANPKDLEKKHLSDSVKVIEAAIKGDSKDLVAAIKEGLSESARRKIDKLTESRKSRLLRSKKKS